MPGVELAIARTITLMMSRTAARAKSLRKVPILSKVMCILVDHAHLSRVLIRSNIRCAFLSTTLISGDESASARERLRIGLLSFE